MEEGDRVVMELVGKHETCLCAIIETSDLRRQSNQPLLYGNLSNDCPKFYGRPYTSDLEKISHPRMNYTCLDTCLFGENLPPSNEVHVSRHQTRVCMSRHVYFIRGWEIFSKSDVYG